MILTRKDNEKVTMRVFFGHNTVGIGYNQNRLHLRELTEPVKDEDTRNKEVLETFKYENSDTVTLSFLDTRGVDIMIEALLEIRTNIQNEDIYKDLHKALEDQIIKDMAEGTDDLETEECCGCGEEHELTDEHTGHKHT